MNTEQIWKKFGEDLRRFVISRVKDEFVTDDIIQDIFEKIHNKIDTLKDETKIHAWIFQIARNSIIDHYREQNKSRKIDLDQSNSDNVDDQNELMGETLKDLILAMDELPEEYCEALCLTEFDGMTQKEYAEKIGISYSGVKSRVQRARSKLCDILMKCCHYQFDKYGTILDIHPHKCCCCSSDNKEEE